MYLSRLTLNHSRQAVLWASNSYRVHQRLKMACENEPRLLFRIEEYENKIHILAQSVNPPDWERAFSGFPVLAIPPESKPFNPHLQSGRHYRFRLLANPTIKKTIEMEGKERRKTRLGLFREADQLDWLRRKLAAAGTEVVIVNVASRGLKYNRKNPAKAENGQTHLSVLYDGVLLVKDPTLLERALQAGIGPAKGFGFGLLSLAPVSR